jgi:ribonuclease HII
MYLIGIDDAGRGPLIGNMFLSGILIKKEDQPELKKLGAKDSKLLAHSERIRLAELIQNKVLAYHVEPATPEEIDSAVLSGENLNTLEARKMAHVINKLNDPKKEIKVIVDCPSINTHTWREKLISFIAHPKNLDVVCEHKADFNHPVVSAASILAKVAREDHVEMLREAYPSIGSGYPSDPTTKVFLREHGAQYADSGIFRKSWATWQDIFPQDKVHKKKGQKNLSEF